MNRGVLMLWYVLRASLHGSSFETFVIDTICVHRCTAHFWVFVFNVQLKLYLLSCTDPHSFARDRGAFEESLACQNDSQSGVWSWPDRPSHNFVMGNLFHVKGGLGRGDSTFLLILTCRVFLFISREGGVHLLSTPDLFPNRFPAKDL